MTCLNLQNVVVNQLFGVVNGLGGSLLTFDWNQIAYNGSPLATPWWAEANVAAGFFVFFCKISRPSTLQAFWHL